MAYSNQLVDKRVIERNIKKGLVDPEQHKRELEALPDTEQNAVLVSLDGSSVDNDDDIDDIDDQDDEDDEEEDAAEG